jgi:cation diffusion facilitator CzcD-associated flavoprotein CzcO
MKIAVIGAGPAGIAAARFLEKMGVTQYVIFEKSDGVGGTWRDNRYPGLTCDVPSHLYRYSFAPNPDWKYEYAPGHEICDYVRKVANESLVNGKLCFGVEVIKAEFEAGGWKLWSPKGELGRFDAVLAATGILRHPVIPKISGVEGFTGDIFHAALWPEGYVIEGKRVGVVGTGSTAVQIFPAIIDRVQSGKLFQRTPQWIFPAKNNPISQEKRDRFRQSESAVADLYTFLAKRFNGQFAAAVVGENDEALQQTTQACLENLNTVKDESLRKRLTPDYEVGCKRLVVSDKFYAAIQNKNAELIDIGIDHIEAGGIRTVDGQLHELDTIVFATGYDPFKFVRPMEVIGRAGITLDDYWQHSHKAYRSIGLPDFPNFFLIGGPNSPIGNFSYIMTAEAQIQYICQLLAMLKDGKFREISPTHIATERFNAEVSTALPKTVWARGGCTSWYYDKNGSVAAWPWTYERFQSDMDKPNQSDFDLR